MTINHAQLAAPWRHGDPAEIVARAPGRARTRHEFHARIGAWQRLPCPAGRPVALFEPDPWEFVSALLACWHLGYCVWLPGDDRPETLARLADDGAWLAGRLPGGWSPAEHGHVPAVQWGALAPSTPAVELFTSGSSGTPTRIAKTFAQLDSECAVLARHWPLAAGVVVSQVSHQHIYGLTSAILRPLWEQRPFALETCSYPETLGQYLDTSPVSAVISSPAQLERLPATLAATDRGVACIYASGAPLTQPAATHAERILQAPVIELYGSSETGGIAWRRQRQSPAWTAMDDVELATVGELLKLRSPRLADPATWRVHADRVVLHDARHFTLQGRADRIAKIGGKRVSLEGLARHLEGQAGIRRAHCVTIDHSGGRIGAIVQLEANRLPHDHAARRTLIATLRTALAAAFEPVVLPRFWRFVESWPVNPQGKLTRAIAARLFADLDDRRRPRWLGETFETPECVKVTLEVPERLAQLDGHFPQRPIVPGIVIVQWALWLAAETFATAPSSTLERVKFPRPLLPGERATLTLTRASDSRLDFKLESRHGLHAIGRGLCRSISQPKRDTPMRGSDEHV